MKIKEIVKKNHRVIKIARTIIPVVIPAYIAYSVGEYNGIAYAGRRIARVLSEEELIDVRKRLVESRIG